MRTAHHHPREPHRASPPRHLVFKVAQKPTIGPATWDAWSTVMAGALGRTGPRRRRSMRRDRRPGPATPGGQEQRRLRQTRLPDGPISRQGPSFVASGVERRAHARGGAAHGGTSHKRHEPGSVTPQPKEVVDVLSRLGEITASAARSEYIDPPEGRPCDMAARVESLARWPQDYLRDDDTFPVVGNGGPFVQLVSQFEHLTDTSAESFIIGSGEDAVYGQVLWWLGHEDQLYIQARIFSSRIIGAD